MSAFHVHDGKDLALRGTRAPRLLNATSLYAASFGLMVALYCVVWERQGLSMDNSGFVLGLSWRVWNGQIPYLDFIYVRPDLSLYLHCIPLLFGDYAIFADRCMTTLEVAVTALSGTFVLQKVLSARPDSRAVFWSGAAAAFVLTAHNFPLFGWHTIDAVAFGSLALLSVTARRFALGGALAMAAGLCKQNFLTVPLFIGVALVVVAERRAAIAFMSAALAPLGAWLLVLWAQGSLAQMTANLFGGTSQLGDIWAGGVTSYVKMLLSPTFLKIVVAATLVGGAVFATRWRRFALDAAYVATLVGAMLALALSVYRASRADLHFDFFIESFNVSAALLAVAFIVLAVKIAMAPMSNAVSPNRLGITVVLGYFVLAWTASISWGYQVPALCAVVFLAPLFLCAPRFPLAPCLAALAAIGLATFGYALTFPFGEGTRLSDLSEIPATFPHARFIRTNPDTLEKLDELKVLQAKFGAKSLIVLPTFTASSLLLDVVPKSRIDLALDAEVPVFERSRLVDDLCSKRLVAAMDRHSLARFAEGTRFFSSASAAIRSRWINATTTKHFDVYVPPASCDPKA